MAQTTKLVTVVFHHPWSTGYLWSSGLGHQRKHMSLHVSYVQCLPEYCPVRDKLARPSVISHTEPQLINEIAKLQRWTDLHLHVLDGNITGHE